MASNKGLGKGLGALLGESAMQPVNQQSPLLLPLQKIEPNRLQPRRNFDEEELSALADSIRQHGVIQPLTVRLLDSGYYQIIAGDTDQDCAAKAVALCAQGKANFLMKGILGTADLMRAVFNKEHGLRTQHLTTHCMLYEIPALGRMLVLTDGGVNTFPDLEKKADILENAAMVLQALGYEHINASCVCGAEQVNPKVQSTVDADALSKMTDRWAKYNMDVCGPVALDLAVSEEACRHKHYNAPGAGKADILLVPNYEVGNGIGKAANLFGNAKNAGIILGAKVPIVLVSRADSAYSKLASIALGSVLSSRMKLA